VAFYLRYTAVMTVRRILAVVILLVALGAPLIEAFDRWDRTLQDGYDTEMTVVVIALCVGLGFAVAGATSQSIRSIAWRRAVRSIVGLTLLSYRAIPAPAPSSSPPIPLRV
jgi:hypothetical protein